jgi:hypothetical protein
LTQVKLCHFHSVELCMVNKLLTGSKEPWRNTDGQRRESEQGTLRWPRTQWPLQQPLFHPVWQNLGHLLLDVSSHHSRRRLCILPLGVPRDSLRRKTKKWSIFPWET